MKSKTRLKMERMMQQMDADMEEFFKYNNRKHEQDKCPICKYFGGLDGDCFWCNKAPCDNFNKFEKKIKQ